MRFTKAKLIVTGMIMAAVCAFAPQQLKAEVPGFRMDGVMGQSIEDETSYDVTPVPMLLRASAADASPSTAAVSSYTQDFLDKSFTTEGDFTDATYYHKADYEDYLMLQGIDVSWWQAKDKKTTLLDWEKIHDAGIDFTFVRAASRDSKDGSIYEDTAADSHIQAALENDMNVGLYVFSQALTEAEAKEEADYLLRQIKKYNWDITMPLVIDREKGSYNRLTEGKLSKAKETAVCQAFADTITEAGYRACVYASYAWIKSYINTDSLEDCGIWIARYNNTTTSNSKSGSAYADVAYDYDFWQYSSVARIDGYSGNLDANFWYKDTGIQTTGLKAEAGSAFEPVTLSWKAAADDVKGYRVYRYDPKQEKYVHIKTTGKCSFVDEDVTAGTTYQYKVRCYWTIGGTNYYGTTSSAVSVDVPLAQVTGVGTAKRGSTSLTISWDKVSGASGYRLYRYNPDSKGYEKVVTLSGGTNTSYNVSGLDGATEYRFKVKAYKKVDGVVSWGIASAEYRQSTNPWKVKNLKLSKKSTTVTLKWDKVRGATGYQLYRYNSGTRKYEKIATIRNNTTFSYKDTNRKKGQQYTYKIRAYKIYDGKVYHGVCSNVAKITI
ncbi:MAG: fibronectin type III domain-containing protein [Lachnospiraceae bacterium]|nr:fibronectin type III domain-containing protein [Lachnospiraceae bacterium]